MVYPCRIFWKNRNGYNKISSLMHQDLLGIPLFTLSPRPARVLYTCFCNRIVRRTTEPLREVSGSGGDLNFAPPTLSRPQKPLFSFVLILLNGGTPCHTIIIYFRNVFLMSAMVLRSLNLPGVGTKYEIETDKGDTIAIFFTKTRTIQMYTLQKGCRTPSAAEMTPVEARRLGNILTGAIIEADQESVEIAFSALADLRVTIHTFYIPKTVVGKTIEDLQIRAKTGATVIAICRHDKNIINPPPSLVFESGDTALVIGESDQIKKFEREIMVE
jgi:TrkA domain protein